jgi:hypothetical protein
VQPDGSAVRPPPFGVGGHEHAGVEDLDEAISDDDLDPLAGEGSPTQ